MPNDADTYDYIVLKHAAAKPDGAGNPGIGSHNFYLEPGECTPEALIATQW